MYIVARQNNLNFLSPYIRSCPLINSDPTSSRSRRSGSSYASVLRGHPSTSDVSGLYGPTWERGSETSYIKGYAISFTTPYLLTKMRNMVKEIYAQSSFALVWPPLKAEAEDRTRADDCRHPNSGLHHASKGRGYELAT